MSKQIVTVWLDETSDTANPKWIVDTDTEEGGESITIKTFDTKAQAEKYAQEFAASLGMTVKQA